MGFSIDDHVVAVHVVMSQPGGRICPLFRGQETSVVRRFGDEKESRKATSDCDDTYEATERVSSALHPSGLCGIRKLRLSVGITFDDEDPRPPFQATSAGQIADGRSQQAADGS